MSAESAFKNLPLFVLRPVPVPLYRPFLRRIVRRVMRRHPNLFNRLGGSAGKMILVNPVNMPVVFLLEPCRENPRVTAFRHADDLQYDASVTGSLLTLLRMVDGRIDGDAVFFTRDLVIDGDTEAVVALRNALDDVEGSVADDIAACFGLPGRLALSVMRRMDARQQQEAA